MVADQFYKVLPIAILSLLEQLELGTLQDIVLDFVDGALLHDGVEFDLVLGGVVLDVLHFIGDGVHVVVYGDRAIR